MAGASDGKLDVLPLTDPDVQQWRRLGMGPAPKWAPALLRVRGDDVRAWTGPTMGLAMAGHLGPRGTVRVLRALGQLREAERRDSSRESGTAMGRKQFIRLLGGTATAIGLTVAGQTPAFARSEHARASAWVEANLENLPREYAEIVRHPISYRQAIFRVLSPREQADVWLEHLKRYRAGHPDLSAAQNQVVDEAAALLGRGLASRTSLNEELRRLEESAKIEFGQDEAAALLATLGPAPGPVAAARPQALAADCVCSTVSQYCSWLYDCHTSSCTRVGGCGTLYQYTCNGICY
ncbi:bacteriocin fulvocin C-related protein [Streptomyces atratus]|uniref:bacteriocin fulvocin C-related protein n=1 Tax=Streptomyces atratus TaxID=1893 RepID=UPI0033CB9619